MNIARAKPLGTPTRWLGGLFLALLLALTACADRARAPSEPRQGLAPGIQAIALTVEGQQRHYLVYISPTLAERRPAPLLLAIHGAGSRPENFSKVTRFNQRAGDERGYVVVYPAGYQNFWHSSDDCCGPPQKQNIDDVAFIRAVLNDVGQRVAIDDRRIYAAGFSNGGMMVYRLACEMPGEFAAIAVNASSIGVSRCAPSIPTPVLHFHGTVDTFQPYAGVSGTATRFQMAQMGAPETIRRWKRWDGCADTGTLTYRQGAASCMTYDGCRGGAEVVLCTIEGMGHQWPGFAIRFPPRLAATLGPPSFDLDATQMTLDFFARFARNR